MAVSVKCVPIKRTTQTETVIKSETILQDSTAEITRQKLDLVMRSVSELKETMAEWLNEQIDYEEQRYDNLGRLISNIRQTTNRSGGKESVRTDSQNVYIGLTVEQVDSLLLVRFSAIKTNLHAKEKNVKKTGLSWWQDMLIWIGIFACISYGTIILYKYS